MIYELINPSDETTFEAPDDEVACAVALVLGEGHYGVRAEDDHKLDSPLLVFAPKEYAEEYVKRHAQVARNRPGDMAAALESFMYADMGDRVALRAALGDDKDALARWNDAKRGSLNNIAGAAAALAKSYRAKTNTK